MEQGFSDFVRSSEDWEMGQEKSQETDVFKSLVSKEWNVVSFEHPSSRRPIHSMMKNYSMVRTEKEKECVLF